LKSKAMNSDTPETEKNAFPDFERGGDVVLADFARKLERDLNQLREAAQAVVDRWETPLWKDAPASAAFIKNLRNALTDKVMPLQLLKACPFCGLTDIDTISPDMGETPAVSMHSYPGGFRVECEGCGCNGPWHHDHQAALDAWDSRHNDEVSRGDDTATSQAR
jgi:Lar family restriction alleviation protein